MNDSANRQRNKLNFFSSSIRNRIIIPYALLTLVIAAFGTFVVTYLVAGSFEERFRNQLVDAGRVVSDEVVNREVARLEVERAIANTIGVSKALVDQDFDRLNELVVPIVVNNDIADSVILVNTQGKEVLTLQRKPNDPNSPVEPVPVSGVDFFSWSGVANVLADPAGALKEVQLAQDPQLNELIIYTIGPIKAENGTVGAVMVGTYLEEEVDVLHNLALADITLFNEKGEVLESTLISDKDEAKRVFTSFTPERFQKIVALSKEIVFLDDIVGPDEDTVGEVETRGRTYRHAYAPYVLRGRVYGVYGVGLPTNFVTEINYRNRFWLSVIFTLGVVGVLFIGFAISQRIIKPIISLMQTTQDIAQGNLDRRTGLESQDEIGVLAHAFDEMTEELQKKTVALREEASKLNAILNSIADGVIVLDTGGNIITTNPTAEQILQTLGEDFMLQESSAEETGTVGDHDEQSAQLLNRLTGLEFHETRRFEIEQQVLSALSAPVVTSEGERFGMVVVLRDITREVEAERLKDDFITSMSHELRTPPTAIKGYVDLLKMTAAGKLDERQLEFVEKIDENVKDLLNIIQQMLDLSQIDAGTLGIDQELQDITDVVETVADEWRSKMEERELSFDIHLPDEEIWVRGDWSRLTKVVDNLLSNAHHYTLAGGRVWVNIIQREHEVQVDINDTGVGISKENQRFLFTRFFRAIHEESTFEQSGAGLGLYMSKAIIEAHGGRIWMQSELNRGSTFSFALQKVDPDLVDEEEEEVVEYLNT